MDYQEFTELVRDMRQAQRQYFKTRNPEILEKSKQLEKAVDSEIEAQLLRKQLTLL